MIVPNRLVDAPMPEFQKHKLNEGFSWPERVAPFRLVSDQQAEQWNRAGYFLLEQVIDADTIAALIDEIDPLEEKTEAFLRTQENGRYFIQRADEISFTTHIVTHSGLVREFLQSELFVSLCLDLIGDDTRLYWDQAVYKKPGSPEIFPWHQDNGYNFVVPQDYLTCWIPLNDVTGANGCPWVVPGVHRIGTLEHKATDLGFECFEAPENAIPVPASAGDIVVFSSLTPHMTGPNVTDSVRRAYIAQYAHDGAAMFPRQGEQNILQDDEQRQFPITVKGKSA